MNNQKSLRVATTIVVAGLGIIAFVPSARSDDNQNSTQNQSFSGTTIGQPSSGLNNTGAAAAGSADRTMDQVGARGMTLDAASKAQIQTAIGKLVDDATQPSRFNALIQDLSMKDQQRLQASTGANASANTTDQANSQFSQAA